MNMSLGPLWRVFKSVRVFLEMVKISHTVFALPFALAALFLAARGLPSLLVFLQVLLAVLFARTAAMSFNRWADAELDSRNPRTSDRAIPAGLLPRWVSGAATLLAAALFVLTAAWINPLAFKLCPVVLLVLLGYSYTKRFTRHSHLVLGLALGLSPAGAWVAQRGELDWLPLILGGAVLFWTAGFDIIYACQDIRFDRAEGLRSIPERWGTRGALRVSRAFHATAVALLLWVGFMDESLGWIYFAGVTAILALLGYEHSLVRPGDLSRIQKAFFTVNGVVSVTFLCVVVLETLH